MLQTAYVMFLQFASLSKSHFNLSWEGKQFKTYIFQNTIEEMPHTAYVVVIHFPADLIG